MGTSLVAAPKPSRTSTGFLAPMLASPMPKHLPALLHSGSWAAEEKVDGHRLIVEVEDGKVAAWSREGRVRALPAQVHEACALLPDGCYDGELHIPGKRSWDVVRLYDAAALVFTVFDVLSLLGTSTISDTYDRRREYLSLIFSRRKKALKGAVRLSESRPVVTADDVQAFAVEVWASGGEGLIVKKRTSTYRLAKRSPDWFKVKKLQTAALTVTGYEAGEGGPYSVVKLVDDDGNETSVKTRNTVERKRIAADPDSFVGRKLRIEFQEFTPDGYRHGRWDRWETE